MTLIPTQITFKGIHHDDALEQLIRSRVDWLEQVHDGIVRCRVVVDVPHRHQRTGRAVHVHIEATVPAGPAIVVNHQPSLHGTLKDTEATTHHKAEDVATVRQDAEVAVRQAFDVARRRLEDAVRDARE